jgi:predicted RNA binding protein YcfA (HicA-like mRNA interferase family)
MSKLPILRSRDVIRVLQQIGFVEDRQKGSHKIFKKGTLRVTVPIHTRDLKRGTVRSIVEQTGLTEGEFIELLK